MATTANRPVSRRGDKSIMRSDSLSDVPTTPIPPRPSTTMR